MSLPGQVRRTIKSAVKTLIGRSEGVPDWLPLVTGSEWEEVRQAAQDGQRVLIAPSMGGFRCGALLESALAVALTLRGARVDTLLCDSVLPACQLTEIGQVAPERLVKSAIQPRCDSCQTAGERMFAPLKLPLWRYSQFVEPAQRQEAKRIAATIGLEGVGEFRQNGIAVGEHALAGALRFFARGALDGESSAELILRRYLEAALLTMVATEKLLERHAYEVVCFNHGLYVPQGIIGEVCRQRGARVVNWNPAYRKSAFVFSHGDTYHHTMISEPASHWEDIAWTPAVEKETLDYLQSRYQGTRDWIWFHDTPQEDIAKIADETGVDFSKPVVGMLTNVMWDAQLHYGSNAFQNMLEWVLESIAYFARRPELQLVIRVHPAEIRGSVPSRQPLVDAIAQAYPQLPPNVFVVPPESQISTYTLSAQCNAVIIYNTKTGIEVTSMGVPVIVAGEAWIRDKGFSLDARSPEEYFRILDGLPLAERLTPEQTERARKYAFHFFCRRMIPLPFIVPSEESGFALSLCSLEELRPGNSPGLDVVCEGILNETPFIYPAERPELLHRDA